MPLLPPAVIFQSIENSKSEYSSLVTMSPPLPRSTIEPSSTAHSFGSAVPRNARKFMPASLPSKRSCQPACCSAVVSVLGPLIGDSFSGALPIDW